MKPKPLIVQARVEGGELKVPGRKFLLAALKGWPDGARPDEVAAQCRHSRGPIYWRGSEDWQNDY